MSKKYFKQLALGFCLANLLLFLRFYITDYLPSVNLLKVSDAVYYILYYPAKLIEFCIAPIAAVALFSLFHSDRKKLILSSLFLSLSRAVYLLPYYYLYENALGNDSLESIGLSLLISLGGIIILTVHILVLAIVFRFVMQRLIKKELCKELPYLARKEYKEALASKINESMGAEFLRKSFFDLSIPVVSGIFTVSFLEFIYPLINEIIATVHFFAKAEGSYTTVEIFTIAFSFIFVLIELVVLHVLGILIKDWALNIKKGASVTEE